MHLEVRMCLALAVVNEEYVLHRVSLMGFEVSLKKGTENHIVH